MRKHITQKGREWVFKAGLLIVGLCLPPAAPGFSRVSAGHVHGVFAADNIWNTSLDNLPIEPNSPAYIATIGSGITLHADFGPWNLPPEPAASFKLISLTPFPFSKDGYYSFS
ncbi:MAG: hypothetical protein ABFD97_00265 [Syntrophobacter sp.]